MDNDPNSPQPPPYGQPDQPQPQGPYGQPLYGRPPYEQSGQPQAPYGQPPYYQPQPQWDQQGPPPYNPAQYGIPPDYNYMPPQQQPKKSRRWLWITLAIIGGVLVLGCAGCGVLAATGIGFFAKTVGAPTIVATEYYQAIENRDYSKAYSYLAPDATVTVGGQPVPVTQTAFMAAAMSVDTAQGKVTNFSPAGFSMNNNIANFTMLVTRSGKSYDVHLQLQQEGNSWKITTADGI